MLTADQYLGWHQALQLRPAAIEVIDRIRGSPPARRVTSGNRNVSGSYPSTKMGLTIQFESHTNQFAAVLEYEHDDDVLEYWDQPNAPLQLSLKARNGKTVTLDEYVPAFFVLRTNSAGWVDYLTAQSIEKRTLRWPERYERDTGGDWHDRAGEACASRLGLGYSIRTAKPEDAVVQRNLEFLDDYLRSPRPLRPEPETAALVTVVRHAPGITLRELLNQSAAADLIYSLIANSAIYVDLRRDVLSEPDRVRVFPFEEAAVFERFRTAHAEPEIRPAPAALLQRLSSMGPAEMREANRRCMLLEQALRGEPVPGVPDRTLRDWRRRFRNAEAWYGNGYLGLLPNYDRSGNRSSRLPPETVELMDDIIRREYETLKQPTIAAGLWFVPAPVRRARLSGHQLRKLPRSGSRRPAVEQVRKRRGPRASYAVQVPWYELEYHTPRHGDRAFQICHIDHTELDLELVASQTGQCLGRPWLTMLIDAFSRRILSFFLTYDPPSYRSCMMVLREAVRRHERFPQTLVVDGGAEFRSQYLDTLLARYECTKKLRPRAKPRSGSVIERIFGTTNTEFVYALAGNTQLMKNVRQVTKSVNPRNHAVWTLEDVAAHLSRWAYEHYDQTAHPAFGETPRAAFERSLLESGLRSHRRVEYDQEFLMLTLPSTPKGTARVIPSKGVQIRNIYYWSQAFANPETGKTSVPIRYDPFDIGVAYAFIEGQWTQCISEHYAKLHGRSEREIKMLTAELRRQAAAHTTQFDSRLKSRAAFIHEVANTEASLAQRLKDLENQAVVRSLGVEQGAIRPADTPAPRRLSREDLSSYEEY